MISAGLVDELRAGLAALYAEATRPAGQDGIEAAIRPWFATYPQPQRKDGEWAAFWQGYVIACGHHSEAALHGAMRAWSKLPDSEFLPKPGKLAELARTAPTAAFRLAGRAHQVLQLVDDMQDRQRVASNLARDHVKTEEQIEAVRGLLGDFHAKSAPVREMQQRVLQRGSANAAKPDYEPPYSGGTPPPGHGITREMMRVMGWPEPPEAPPQFSEDFS